MIRFGIIGTNWITEEFLKGANEHNHFKLTAVYSRTEETAKSFADKHGVQHTFTDLQAFAASNTFDAVYIASPNSFHAEQAILLMQNGKHVLCEKPFASNAKEVEKMIDAAKRNNVLLMEAMKTTFLPNFKVIQEHIHKIGKIRRYVANYCQYSSRYDSFKNGTILNAFDPTFSNGSLMDIGIYCVYPMVVLFGKPQSIQANGFILSSGVDGQGSIIANYGEFEGVINHSKISNSYLSSEIQGEKGSIVLDRISRTSKVEIRYHDGTVEDITKDTPKHPMFYEVEHFIELLQQNKQESPINSYYRSIETIKILDEARKQIGLIFPADLKKQQ
jgi:predicted dehydrogenase